MNFEMNDMPSLLNIMGTSYKRAGIEELLCNEMATRAERKASYKRREKRLLLDKVNVLTEHLKLLQATTGSSKELEARIEGLRALKDSPRFDIEVKEIRATMSGMSEIKDEIEKLHKVVKLLGN